MTLSIMTLIIMHYDTIIMTLIDTQHYDTIIMTLSIMTISKMTLNIMPLRMTSSAVFLLFYLVPLC